MKAQKLTAIAISTAFISAALTSPAVANGSTVLPFNAQTGNTSGVHIQACDGYVQVSLPNTMADDPHSNNPFDSLSIPAQPNELFYGDQSIGLDDQRWYVDNANTTTAFGSEVALDTFSHPRVAATIPYSSNQTPGETIDLTFESDAEITYNNYSTRSGFVYEDIPIQSVSDLDGSGTELDPYLVTDSDDLKLMRCDLDANYKLTSDIDMTGVIWIPLGLSTSNPFQGVLDGNGKTIANLNVDTASYFTSFLGRAKTAQIFDLTFDSPVVSGIEKVAVLASDAEAVIIENVNLNDIQVTAATEAAGLIAQTDNGNTIKNVNVSGEVNIEMTYTRSGDTGTSPEAVPEENGDVQEVGLAIGYLAGEGDSVWNLDVSGTINVAPRIESLAAADAIIADHFIEQIGLLAGENDEESGVFDSTVNGEINIDFRGSDLTAIGGAFGISEEGGTLYNSEVDVDINLKALKRGTNSTDVSEVKRVGLLLGDNDDDHYFANNIIRGSIDISSDDASRDSSNVNVSEVGALGSEFDGVSILNIDSDVSIKSVFDVNRVGLAVGFMDNFTTISDSIFKGTIDVPVGSTNVAGLAGENTSDNTNLRKVIVAAEFTQTPSAGANAILTNGSIPQDGSSSSVFFDSDLNDADPGEFTSGPAGRAATTEQLKSKSFLEANGYDFENDWLEVEGEYPTPIKPVGASTSTSPAPSFASAPSPAAVIVNSVGNAELGPNGGVITITGKSLTGVRLSLGETPLFVQLLSDTEALVQIPAGLAPGSHDLTATGINGVLTSQDVFTITDLTTTSDTGFWTTRNGDNVKIYAKNIIGSGKVQFFVNGEEIAWVNATDNSDEKLRVINEGPMAGNVYLVRDKDLLDGKNVFEIYVDGERVERRVASK